MPVKTTVRMKKKCKLRPINLAIFGKIKIYKKTTVLEEKRLKKLHKINPCFVYINPREEALCLKQLKKGKYKKPCRSNISVHQKYIHQSSSFTSMYQSSSFTPNPRILENKPFIKQNSLMAMKQDAFFKKYNLDRNEVMKRCLFYKEDINHFIMVLQRYFDMKDKEKRVKHNSIEHYNDIRLSQTVRVLLTPLKEVNKCTKVNDSKKLDQDRSEKLLVVAANESNSGARNYLYTDDGMTDADEMDIDNTLPKTSSEQNKKVHQIDIEQLFISDENGNEVTDSETDADKSGDTYSYTVSLAAQMQLENKVKFKDILMDVASEFERFSIDNDKNGTMNTVEALKITKPNEYVSVQNESLKNNVQNSFDIYEKESCYKDDLAQGNDTADLFSKTKIMDKQDVVVSVETERDEESSSSLLDNSGDDLNMKDKYNDCPVPEVAESQSIVSGSESSTQFVRDSVNESEKHEPSNKNDNETENLKSQIIISDGSLTHISKDSDNESEKHELLNKSDNLIESHNDLPKKCDLDRKSVIQRYFSEHKSSTTDDESSLSQHSLEDKSKGKSSESDYEGDVPVTRNKDEGSTEVKHSEDEMFCVMDTNAVTDSRTDADTVIAGISAIVKLNEEKLKIKVSPVKSGIGGTYESDAEIYDEELSSGSAFFSFLVTSCSKNKEG